MYSRQYLAHPRFALYISLFSCFLGSSSLWNGFQADDYLHRIFLSQKPVADFPHIGPCDLFSFANGKPVDNYRLMNSGVLPWWTLPEFHASFFRPVSVLTHYLDYFLFPDSPFWMHLHSLLWLLILNLTAAGFFKFTFGNTWAAGLATLFYALDDARGYPVGWLANRNGLIAAAFGIAAILLHLKWRGTRKKRYLLESMFFYALALLSAEAAIAVMGFILASLVIDTASRYRKLLILLPSVIITLIWWTLHHHFGYRIFGSGLYRDPLIEPLEFAKAVLFNAPIFLQSQFGFIPASAVLLSNSYIRIGILLFSIAFCGLLIRIIFPLIRNDPIAQFFAMGTLFSLIPICSTFSHERVLTFTGIGAFGLIGHLLYKYMATEPAPNKPHSKSLNCLAWFLLIVHGVLSPLMFPLTAWAPKLISQTVEAYDVSLPQDESILEKTLILINPPIPFLAHHVLIRRAALNLPSPETLRVLASGTNCLDVFRQNENTLIIQSNHAFVSAPMDTLFRGEAHTMKPHDSIRLTETTIYVENTSRIRFVFDEPLNSPRYTWFEFKNGQFVAFIPPEIGKTTRLASNPLYSLPLLNKQSD